MEKLLTVFYFFVVLSIICPIINYSFLYLSTKFKFFTSLTSWMLTDFSEGEYHHFITPLMSWMVSFVIIAYIGYRFIGKPLYYLVITLPMVFFEWIGGILIKPIQKNDFKNQLSRH